MLSMAGVLSRWFPIRADKALSRARNAFESGDYTSAFEVYQTLAMQGNSSAQFMLGCMYNEGRGVTANYEEAAKWTELAAESGNLDAQFNLAVMYGKGLGVRQDNAAAVRWYLLSAQRGHSSAQANLAVHLREGLGTVKDEVGAFWWASLAANQGDVNAQMAVGRSYLEGTVVGKDSLEAYFWFDRAARAGDQGAIAYKAAWDSGLTSEAINDLHTQIRDLDWKPQTSTESALQVFKYASRQTIEALRQFLGEKEFDSLRTTTKEIPSAGHLILEGIHGLTQPKIVSNIQSYLLGLESSLDSGLNTLAGASAQVRRSTDSAKTMLGFIRRIDDTADMGAVLGEGAAEFTQNLLEYHLSLIGELEKELDGDTVAMLLKRFSLRQALRSSKLTPFAGLHKTLLPIQPS